MSILLIINYKFIIENRGFTLLEILVALFIIGILVAIATPLYFDAIRQAKRNAQLENMRIIKTSLELYYLKTIHILTEDLIIQEMPGLLPHIFQ